MPPPSRRRWAFAAAIPLLGAVAVLVGDDPGSHAYVGGKHRDCAEIGIRHA